MKFIKREELEQICRDKYPHINPEDYFYIIEDNLLSMNEEDVIEKLKGYKNRLIGLASARNES